MNSKPLKLNGIRLAQVATGMSPADFPIGSLQSRAIARAVLDQTERMTPRMSQYEEDALAIYRGSKIFLHVGMSPGPSDLEKTKVYSDGEALDQLSGGTAEDFEEVGDPTDRLQEIISNCIERARLEPLEGLSECTPALRREIVFSFANKLMLRDLEQAWTRQLPGLPFPIRTTEDTRPLVRRRNGEWEEAGQYELRHLSGWRLIEEASRVEENF
jgi:hypothetical protein